MFLLSLSNELLLQIIEEIAQGTVEEGKKWVKPAANIALSCKRLNKLATPILYRSINDSGHRRDGAALWLWTILRKPEYTKFIRRMRVHCGTEDDRNYTIMSKFSRLDFDRCRELLVATNVFQTKLDLFRVELESGNQTAIIALLLMALPNLEALDIRSFDDGPGETENAFIHDLFDAAGKSQIDGYEGRKILYNLSGIMIRFWRFGEGLSLGPLTPFFLPSVAKANIRGVADNEFSPARGLQKGTRLQELKLVGKIDHDALALFLKQFTMLRKFDYCNTANSRSEVQFYPQKLRSALLHVQNCLEDFTIRDSQDDYPFAETELRLPFGSLKNFTALKRLDMNPSILLGKSQLTSSLQLSNILPLSIEHLSLWSSGPDVWDQVNDLIARKDNLAPKLRKLEMWMEYDKPTFPTEDVRSEFVAKSLKVGVNVILWC